MILLAKLEEEQEPQKTIKKSMDDIEEKENMLNDNKENVEMQKIAEDHQDELDDEDVEEMFDNNNNLEAKITPHTPGTPQEPTLPTSEQHVFDKLTKKHSKPLKCAGVDNWLLDALDNDENDFNKYFNIFISNGFDSLNVIQNMTNQDLIDIGINKLGHRRKILAKIANNTNNTTNMDATIHTEEVNDTVEGDGEQGGTGYI